MATATTTTTTTPQEQKKKKKQSSAVSTYGIFLISITAALLSFTRINYYHFQQQLNDAEVLATHPHNSQAKPLPFTSRRDTKSGAINLSSDRKSSTIARGKRGKHWKDHLQRQKRLLAKQSQNRTDRGDDSGQRASAAMAQQLFVVEANLTRSNSNSANDSEPWLVLHIGPPKTATTTIQCGLEKHSLRLAKTDGYHFLGGGCGIPMQEYYMPNGEQTVLRRMLIMALHQSAKDVPVNPHNSAGDHLEAFVERARFLRKAGASVILSGEQFGSQLSNKPSVMAKAREMLVDPHKGAGFLPHRVRIVLAYRHFVDWLPSFHYQQFLCLDTNMDREWLVRGNKSMVRPFLEYADEYLTNWEDHQKMVEAASAAQNHTGETKEHFRPGTQRSNINGSNTDLPREMGAFLDNPLDLLANDRQSIHPSWWLYQLWSSYFPLHNQVQVYDMHSPMNSNRPEDDMVTNFVCHMLPDANHTCSRLMFLKDEQRRHETKDANETNRTGGAEPRRSTPQSRMDVDDKEEEEEPDYENLHLHSRFSMLFPGRKDPTLGVGDANAEASEGEGQQQQQAMALRPSSDHHATRIVETLLAKGSIPTFRYEKHGPAYFETHAGVVNASMPEIIGGHTKSKLIGIAKELLDRYNVYSPSSKKPSSERFSGKYFDCMPRDLEDRLLRASSTFLDLMYKHTPMLSLSAMASTHTTSQKASIAEKDDEQAERWTKARADHSRLFETNKAKGKYCDINPDRVFDQVPALYESLVSLSYKPSYKRFKYQELSPTLLRHLETLGFDQKSWEGSKIVKLRNRRWDDLSPEQMAASFALGWNENTWNRFG
jgi:hypothetical protein